MGVHRAAEKYEAFIKNSSEGIWLFELETPIPVSLKPAEQVKHMFKYAFLSDANEATAPMYGVKSVDELIGARLTDFMSPDDPQNNDYLLAFVQSNYRLNGVDSHEKDMHGNEKYFRNSLVGVVEDGLLKRAWGTQQDVTEQTLALQSLKGSEERLALAIKASGLGIWEWNVITGELLWSDELKKLFGLKTTDAITYEKYLKMLHPDDKKKMQQLIAGSLKTGHEYQVEHRVIHPNGSIHWVLGQGKAYLKKGKPTIMIGTSISIDDTKRKDELEEINTKLKEQREQLVQLNNTKDEFISLASHQLRTPATAVKQYLHMLMDGYYGNVTSDQNAALKTAYDSNERQLTIINDLLRVAQIDAGKIILRKEKTNIVELVREVITELSERFNEKMQKIKLITSKPEIYTTVDQARIRMALENIIDNANKYTPPNKNVRVSIEEKLKSVTITVKDEGYGIAKADMARLFQKFSRLENPLNGQVSGTGIGLYWAHKIVELHDGTLKVKSTPPNGTAFIMKLPIK